MSPRPQFFAKSLLISAALALTACGGGSSGGSNPVVVNPPPPPPPGGTTYTQGQFAPESQFKDMCQNPRSGTNDQQGSTALENFWLRSWSNDKYLWYRELPDLNPNSYNNRITYFDLLKTNATTSSGTPKDQFHFNENTADYQQRVNSGASSGYGARFVILDSTAPDRVTRVSFTEPNSPASNAGLLRGTEILEVDGASVADGSAAVLNAGLFPANDGETHNFKVRDVGSTAIRDISMTSALVTSAPVNVQKTITTPSGQVGYMLFNTFGTSIAEEAVVDAMTDFQAAGVTDLVLDLRYNGGGFLDIAGELGYMIAGSARTSGKTFDAIQFNDKYPNTNPVTGASLTGTPFHSTGQGFSVSNGTALPSLNLPRVFVLSTGRTCSASEAVINGLRGVDVEVILIGSRTCGKPYGFYATDNCGETYFTIQFRGTNNKGFGDYADGFTPNVGGGNVGELITGCAVDDDYLNQLGNSGEAMLSTALSYIDTGTCPAATASAKTSISKPEPYGADATAIGQIDRVQFQDFLETSRIINRPDPRSNQKGSSNE